MPLLCRALDDDDTVMLKKSVDLAHLRRVRIHYLDRVVTCMWFSL